MDFTLRRRWQWQFSHSKRDSHSQFTTHTHYSNEYSQHAHRWRCCAICAFWSAHNCVTYSPGSNYQVSESEPQPLAECPLTGTSLCTLLVLLVATPWNGTRRRAWTMNEIPAFGMAHRQDLTPSFSLLMINDKQPRPDQTQWKQPFSLYCSCARLSHALKLLANTKRRFSRLSTWLKANEVESSKEQDEGVRQYGGCSAATSSTSRRVTQISALSHANVHKTNWGKG